jgi:hypothetical protein
VAVCSTGRVDEIPKPSLLATGAQQAGRDSRTAAVLDGRREGRRAQPARKGPRGATAACSQCRCGGRGGTGRDEGAAAGRTGAHLQLGAVRRRLGAGHRGLVAAGSTGDRQPLDA